MKMYENSVIKLLKGFCQKPYNNASCIYILTVLYMVASILYNFSTLNSFVLCPSQTHGSDRT